MEAPLSICPEADSMPEECRKELNRNDFPNLKCYIFKKSRRRSKKIKPFLEISRILIIFFRQNFKADESLEKSGEK
jgi:hypothetical protein